MTIRFTLPTAILTCVLSLGLALTLPAGDPSDLDLEKYAEELQGIGKREPKCLVDAHGLPQRVIITRNGTVMFEQPKDGAKPLKTLALYERLFLYVEDTGNGFLRLGTDPFGEGPTGWVPEAFCLQWNHDEMLFLNDASVPDEVRRIHVWRTHEDALKGDPSTAIYSENIEPGRGNVSDLFFPVLEKDRTGTLYKIGFLFGGDGGNRNEYGQKLTPREINEIAHNLHIVNVQLVMDATGSMAAHIAEAKRRATEVVDALERDLVLQSLTTEGKRIDLTVNFGLLAFRDRGDEFEIKTFVPLTNDRERIKTQIASLEAAGGGDEPELVVPALQAALATEGLVRGALNVIVLIGDAPPHEQEESILTELGHSIKAKYCSVQALVCGESAVTSATFETIATASGGKTHKIADAKEAIDQILTELKTRLSGLPIEEALVEGTVQDGQSFRKAGQSLGLSARETRMLGKFLVARGADVAPAESEFRSGWIKVRPGTQTRLKLHVYTPRWKLAQTLASMLGISQRITLRKNLAKDAPALVKSFLGLQAGGASSAVGLDKSGQSVADRAQGLPETTPGVERGERAAVQFNQQNRAKILKLIEYWRNVSLWEHEFCWIPVELLP